MTKVMQNVRVLEVAQYTFVPAAGAVLADWGADVIKVERPGRGDAQREFRRIRDCPVDEDRNILMQHPNRGKRSIAIDITAPEGLELIYLLAAESDVFLTNYLPSARRKLKIDVEDIRQHNPKIIYARGSALGDRGPERERGGFDSTAFWARGGSAILATPPEFDVPLLQPGPAYGDTIGGMNIAGGIAAALFHRERTGEASEVDVSLLSSGVWATAASIAMCLDAGASLMRNEMPQSGSAAGNPFAGVFRTADGAAINLTILSPAPLIRDTFEHLDLAALADEPRFASHEALIENAGEAGRLITEAFARKPLSYWIERLKTMKGQWAPYQNVLDAGRDAQVLANDLIIEVDDKNGGLPIKLVANPVQFDHTPVTTVRAPDPGEHTDEVLAELGWSTERIAALRHSRAIG